MAIMEVLETLLPGVGVRYEFTTSKGSHLGVIAYRDGKVDLVAYDADDPDSCHEMAQLTRAEAEAIAELLGAPRITERLADLSREVPGLVATQIDLPDTSPYNGGTLGDTKCRTRTGCSIVAIVRGDQVVSAPGPQEPLRAADVLVVTGTEEGVVALRRLLGAASS